MELKMLDNAPLYADPGMWSLCINVMIKMLVIKLRMSRKSNATDLLFYESALTDI